MNFSRLISNVGMLAALATIALASYFTIGTLDETDADSSIYLPVLTKAQVQANIKITKVVMMNTSRSQTLVQSQSPFHIG